jgi:hypothetical protein
LSIDRAEHAFLAFLSSLGPAQRMTPRSQ